MTATEYFNRISFGTYAPGYAMTQWYDNLRAGVYHGYGLFGPLELS